MQSLIKHTSLHSLVCLAFFSCWGLTLNSQSVVINEFMSKNQNVIADIDGAYSDWIELYNPSDETINLEGFALSDKEDEPQKWVFPSVEIQPNSFLLVFASGKDYQTDELHTNFSIKGSGESLFLSDDDGIFIDSVDEIALFDDQSFGRIEDGSVEWTIFAESTPNTNNANGVVFENNSNVFVNEIMSANYSTIEDFEGDYSDWVELYNGGTETINLSGYTLTDKQDTPNLWTFPNVSISPGGFLLVFVDGKDITTGSELHTNFSLDSGGEDVLFYDPSGGLVNFIPGKHLTLDQSYARLQDGSTEWDIFTSSTPNSSNIAGVNKYELDFSHAPGQYTTAFDLNIYFEADQNTEGVSIFYTTDGSDPTPQNFLFSSPIQIASREGQPNYYSTSAFQTVADIYQYDPVGEVFKVNTIRARAFKNSKPASKIYTKTYMVHPEFNRYQLPMLSIVTDPDNLFDGEKGIYVVGDNYAANPTSDHIMNCFQRGREWERTAHFEFFIDGDTITQNGGLRMHGGGSRRNPQKSLRLYARTEYDKDSRFDHQFFPDKEIDSFKRLVLRAQESSNVSYMTDELASNLCKNVNVGRMATRPIVVFIDGEFWGIYNIRERIDKHFLKDNFGADPDNLTILSNSPYTGGCCEEGNAQEYIAFLDTLKVSDMTTPEMYAYVNQKMDVEQYANYLVTEMWAANYDWPENNVRFWKENNDTARWRWILFDLDFGLRFFDRPSISNYVNMSTPNTNTIATELGNLLFQNQQFEDLFIELFDHHLKNHFTAEQVACETIKYRDLYAPHMQEYFNRFDASSSFNYWENRVEEIYNDFAAFRPCFIQEQILQTFGVTIEVDECEEFIPDETPCTFNDTGTFYNPLNGTYDIGGPSPQFLSIDIAIDTLNSLGASGAVTFNVHPGVYGQQGVPLEITSLGTCSQTIEFQSVSTEEEDVEILSPVYITNSEGISFNGLTFNSLVYVQSSRCIVLDKNIMKTEVQILDSQEVLIQNNTFEASANLLISTPKSTIVQYNNFIDSYLTYVSQVNTDGLPLSIDVNNNEFSSEQNASIYAAIDCYLNGQSVNNISIARNAISGGNYVGINVYSSLGIANIDGSLEISNNMVAAQHKGIQLSELSLSNINIESNNTNVKGSNTEGSIALSIYECSSGIFEIGNNNLINQESGVCMSLINTSSPHSDYNNYYTIGGTVIERNGFAYSDLTIWQEATYQDVHSVFSDPQYISNTDLHISNPFLFTAGNPAIANTLDIDSEVRSIPISLGADEVDALLDLGVTELENPVAPNTIGTHTLIVEVTNFGVYEVDSLTLGWSINDEFQNSYYLNYLDIQPNSSIDLDLAIYNFEEDSTYLLKFWTKNPNEEIDLNPANDTLIVFIIPGSTNNCLAQIDDVVIDQNVEICDDYPAAPLKVESFNSVNNPYFSNTFLLLQNNTIVAKNDIGSFDDVQFNENDEYCIVGLSYFSFQGLDLSSGTLDGISNLSGLNIEDGACIAISECLPLDITMLTIPEIVGLETSCISPTTFLAKILVENISNSPLLDGEAMDRVQNYTINGDTILLELPTDYESHQFHVFNNLEGLCDPSSVSINTPNCTAETDVGIWSIESPNEPIDGGEHIIEVGLKNYGKNQLENVDIHWSINDEEQTMFSYSPDDAILQDNTEMLEIGSFNFETAGFYSLKVWTDNPNNIADDFTENDSLSTTIEVMTTVGINEISEFGKVTGLTNIGLSPIPAQSFVQLQYTAIAQTHINCNIFNITGKQYKSMNFETTIGENNHRLDINDLPSGVYLLQMANATHQQVLKFVVE